MCVNTVSSSQLQESAEGYAHRFGTLSLFPPLVRRPTPCSKGRREYVCLGLGPASLPDTPLRQGARRREDSGHGLALQTLTLPKR
jgi:hypothetical protein